MANTELLLTDSPMPLERSEDDYSFETTIEVIQTVERRSGDLEPGNISANEIVVIRDAMADFGLKQKERGQVQEQMFAMLGLGRFRNEFKQKKTPES